MLECVNNAKMLMISQKESAAKEGGERAFKHIRNLAGYCLILHLDEDLDSEISQSLRRQLKFDLGTFECAFEDRRFAKAEDRGGEGFELKTG